MTDYIAVFVFGAAVGIALHRLIMALVLNECPDSHCSYCQWVKRYRRLHPDRMDMPPKV